MWSTDAKCGVQNKKLWSPNLYEVTMLIVSILFSQRTLHDQVKYSLAEPTDDF